MNFKFKLFLLVFFVVLVSCEREVTNKEIEVLNSIAYVKNEQDPYSGKVIGYYKTGNKKSEGTYKNGIRDSVWTVWYNNGNKHSVKKFSDGQRVGIWTTWYNNGQKSREKIYEKGEELGNWTTWDKNGKKKAEWKFSDDKVG